MPDTRAGRPAASGLPVDVSRETSDKLRRYADLLTRWTGRINLISRSTVPSLWTRHIVDSAQVFAACDRSSGLWLDLGSGAGLPGLVCAIIAAEKAKDMHFVLVDSDARKAAFMATTARELNLQAEIRRSRIESLDPLDAAVISARALAPLPDLLRLAEPHWRAATQGLLLKGQNAEQEIDAAHLQWSFNLDTIPSITDPSATLLKIGDLHRV